MKSGAFQMRNGARKFIAGHFIARLALALSICRLQSQPDGLKSAGEHQGGGESQERNWELMLGPAGFMMPAYPGSDEVEMMPFPFVFGEMSLGKAEAFIKVGDGAGMAITPIESTPLKFAVGLNMGEGRDLDRDDLLAGTPNLKNPVQVFGGAELQSSFGKFATTLKYFPITADYEAQADKDYTGLVVEADWRKEWWPVEFVMLEVGAGLSWMNADYAEAQYSVLSATPQLGAFKANSSIQDTTLSAMAILFFSEHVGLGAMGEMTYLLSDAADSPLTQQQMQPFAGLFAFYRW